MTAGRDASGGGRERPRRGRVPGRVRLPWAPVVAVVALMLVPAEAWACAVCFDPREENRFAFLATTIFLSLVPLGMVGGVGLWLRRRARQLRGLPPETDASGQAGS